MKVNNLTNKKPLEYFVLTVKTTSKSTNKFTIITICKFDDYQNIFESTNKQTNKQSTNNQQTKVDESNKQLTTGREDEEDNRIRRERNKEKISYKDIKKKDDDFIANLNFFFEEEKNNYLTCCQFYACACARK